MSERDKEYEVTLMMRYETMSPSRLEGESYSEYKQRRKDTDNMIKNHLKGKRYA